MNNVIYKLFFLISRLDTEGIDLLSALLMVSELYSVYSGTFSFFSFYRNILYARMQTQMRRLGQCVASMWFQFVFAYLSFSWNVEEEPITYETIDLHNEDFPVCQMSETTALQRDTENSRTPHR